MKYRESPVTVAGIDIGGNRKGCHLVILRGLEVISSINSRDVEYLVGQCKEFGPEAIGIDSPCLWGKPDGARLAERILAQRRIFSFATPTRERAEANRSGFYGWMFNGERVYQSLAGTHPLLTESRYTKGQVTFETFPHAITCAMLGVGVASAKQKRVQRRQLLEDVGIDTRPLKSIDAIDAALCAMTAGCLLQGQTEAYGDAEGGYIFVPAF